MLDQNNIILFWNQGAKELYEYSEEEAIGKRIVSLLNTQLPIPLKNIYNILQKQKYWEGELTHTKKNGEKIFVESRWVFIEGSHQGDLKILEINRDISQHKQTERNLQFLSEASKILFSSLDYQTTLHSVAKLAVPEIADWCNVEMLEDRLIKQLVIAHKDPKKVIWARQLRKKYPPDMNASQGLANVLRTGKSELYPKITDEMLVTAAKDKTHLRLLKDLDITSVMMVPIRIGNRQTQSTNKCVGVITFVTTGIRRRYTKSDLAMAEELAFRVGLAIENARLYQESQKAITLRNEFISIASHELKTPVTSLKVYTQVLEQQFKRKNETDAISYLSKMDLQVDKLTKLISDLLNISKLQLGKLEFQEKVFDALELVKEITADIQPSTSTHKLIIEGEEVAKIYGDRDRIGQIIINLLTNAIKYSPKRDKVIIKILQDKDIIRVSVQDFGIGIDKKHQVDIFEKFYQVNDPKEKTYPGLGIGLYISKEIARRHGGDIKVKSSKGKGSTFTLILPKGGINERENPSSR